MMKNFLFYFVVVFAFSVVVVTIGLLIKFLKSKNVKVDGLLNDAKAAVDTAEKIAAAIAPLFPQYAPFLKTVLRVVSEAVSHAEELWKAAEDSTAVDRKATAAGEIESTLETAGITIDPEMRKFIDALIEMSVRTLPKSTAEKEAAV